MPTPFPLTNQQSTQMSTPLQDVQTPQSAPRRLSSWLDSIFQPVGQAVAPLAQDVAGGITHFVAPSHEPAVRQAVGSAVSGLPRTFAEAAPFMLKNAPGPLKALGLADVALRSFAGTPPEASAGQKLGATALETAAFAGAPRVGGRVAETLAQRGVGRLGQRLGSTAGTLGAFEGVNAATSAVMGQPYDPLTAEHIAGTVASVLPFEAAGVGMDLMGKWGEYVAKQREAEKASQLTQAREIAPEVPRMETLPESEAQKEQDKFKIDPAWQVSVQSPQLHPETKETVPRYVQIDDLTGGENRWSKSPETLKAEGFTLPEGIETLPQGKYKMSEVMEKLKPQEPPALPQLSPTDRTQLAQMQANGANSTTLATAAQKMQESKPLRKPTESIYDYVVRTLGVDSKIDLPNHPEMLLESWQQAWRKGGELLGMPPGEVARLEPWALRLAATAGKGLGETRVLPTTRAIDPASGGTTEGFFTPSRGDVPNAFVALALQNPDPAMRGFYTFAHAFSHELFHNHEMQALRHTFAPEGVRDPKIELIKNLHAQAAQLDQLEMGQSVRALGEMLGHRAPENFLTSRKNFYTPDVQGRSEYLADMFSLTSMAAVSPIRSKTFKAVDEVMRFGGGDFTNFLRGIVSDLATLFHNLAEFAEPLFGWKEGNARKISDIQKGLQKLLASAEESDAAVQHFLQMQQTRQARPWAPIPPVNYTQASKMLKAWYRPHEVDAELQQLVKDVSPMVVPQMTLDPTVEGKRFKFLDFFTAFPQLARIKPELADGASLGRNYGTMAREFLSVVRQFFRDPQTGKEGMDDLIRLAKEGTPLNSAWNEMTLRQNEWQIEHNGEMMPLSEVNKLKQFPTLSKDDQQTMLRLRDMASAANVHSANKHYDSFRNKIGFAVSKGLMSHDLTLKWDEAEKIGKALAGTYLDPDVYALAPQVAAERWGDRQQHQMKVDEYAAKGPVQANAVTKMRESFGIDENGIPEDSTKPNSLSKQLGRYREQLLGGFRQDKQTQLFDFDGKPGWNPEMRLGRWIIAHKEKGKPAEFNGFRHKEDFDKKLAALNELKAKGGIEYLKIADKTDTNDDYAGMNPDQFGSYSEAVEAMNRRVIARMSHEHPEMGEEIRKELLDELKPGRALAAMLESPHMKERRLVGGRENLNMAEGFLHYYNNTAYTIAKRYEIAQQNLYLKDPKMRANPNYVMNMKKYFDEITNNSEGKGVYSFLKKLIAFNYIYFSPSLAFVELTQQGINHIPALMMQGKGFLEALDAVKTANFDVAQAMLKGRKSKLGYDIYETPELTRVMKQAVEKNIAGAGVGWNQEFWELAHDVNFINSRNFFGGNGAILDRTGLIGKPLYQMFKLGTNLHGIAIAQNTKVAFKTAYEHFRGKGETEEAAFKHAEEVTTESMHGGGRASRPLWFLGHGPGSPGVTVGSLMYSLQMYVYNTVAQMGNYLSQAIKNTVKNPTEITAAHKAAATMLGAQLVLAGVGGIPVTSQMISLIEQLFPGTEPRRRMREAFYGTGKWLNSKTHLVGNDEDMGQFLTTAASDGLMTSLFPWNMSNRFELGVLMGVDPYRGFDWKNVVGPGGPLLEQLLVKPIQALGQGDYGEALREVIPNSNVRRLATEAANGWDVRNKDSRLNVELDKNEKILLALGFTPKRVADFQELDQMKRRAEKVHSLDQKKFHEDMAARLVSGDQETVTQQLMQRTRDLPGYDPREGARRIAELVQQREIPYDPLRSGSKTSRSYTIGELFDRTMGGRDQGQAAQPSETERYFQRLGIQQRIGFPEPPSSGTMKEAQLVDMLLRQNPVMSRQEALEMVQQQMRPRTAARLAGY